MTTVSPGTVTTASATRVRTARPRAIPVHAGAAVLFAGVAGLLGIRMAAGQDPALGDGGRPLVPPAARPVLVRRIVVTRRVIEVAAAPAASAPVAPGAAGATPATSPAAPAATGAPAAAAPQQRAAGVPSAAPAAPTSAAAPVPAAEPAPTPAPAPAASPAPAPVATATS